MQQLMMHIIKVPQRFHGIVTGGTLVDIMSVDDPLPPEGALGGEPPIEEPLGDEEGLPPEDGAGEGGPGAPVDVDIGGACPATPKSSKRRRAIILALGATPAPPIPLFISEAI